MGLRIFCRGIRFDSTTASSSCPLSIHREPNVSFSSAVCCKLFLIFLLVNQLLNRCIRFETKIIPPQRRHFPSSFHHPENEEKKSRTKRTAPEEPLSQTAQFTRADALSLSSAPSTKAPLQIAGCQCPVRFGNGRPRNTVTADGIRNRCLKANI